METKLGYIDAAETVKGIVTPIINGTRKEIFSDMLNLTKSTLEDFKHLNHRLNVLTVMVVVQYIALALLALCK